MNEKHETLKVQLDSFMETQAKQENCNREIVVKEIDKFKQDFAHIIDDKNKIIEAQALQLSKLSSEIQYLQCVKPICQYVCEICDYETNEKDDLLGHKQNQHENSYENESELEESDDDEICPTYKCDLCNYKAMYPDNVAFHYREIHDIKMTWEEAETKCKS